MNMVDHVDLRILSLLQPDARLTVAQISEKVGISSTPCWKRIQKMWESKVITGQVTLVDPAKLDLGLTVFVMIRTGHHSGIWADRFLSSVQVFPQIVEIYRLSGDLDYMLKVVSRDMTSYDDFYKRLIRAIEFLQVSSTFVMETIKCTTVVPLNINQNA